MPGRDPLSQLGDLPALQAQADKIIEMVQSVSETIKSVPQIGANYKGATGNAELKQHINDLIKANKDLKTAQEQLDTERAKSLTLEGNIAKQLAIQRELNKTKVTDMRAEAREAAGLNDAYKKLELQYNAAQRAAKNLAATPGTPQAQIDAANKKAMALSTQLKTIDNAVGQNQRNVGNYSGALKTLEDALGNAIGRMDQMTDADQRGTEAGQQLAQEINLLGQLVGQQSKGFTSLSREVMSVGKALETMAEQGMQGTEVFKRLEAQYVSGKRELNEFRKNQQLLTSEAPKLQALTLAAKGLAGMYALGAGASALFADGNEKVEKEINKLVAIMTILQGLQQVHELLEKRSAIATIASNVAQGFKNFVMTGSVKATQDDTAAQSEHIAILEADTEITEADTVAKEAQAVATVEVATATEGASAAMVAFRIALISTGIGAILVLISSAAAAMGVFGKNSSESAKELVELADAINKVNEAILARSELTNDTLRGQKKILEAQLEYAEKSGKNFYEQAAIKKNIIALDKQMAENNLKAASGQDDITKAIIQTTSASEKHKVVLDQLTNTQRVSNKVQAEGIKSGHAEDEKDFQSRQDRLNKRIADARKTYEEDLKLLDDYSNAQKESNSHDIELQKFTQTEQRELVLTTSKIKAESRIQANEQILGDERSTQAQVLAAMKSNLQQHLAIINAEEHASLQTPGNTPAKIRQITQEAEAARAQAKDEARENERKKNLEYWKRDQAAYMEIQKDMLSFSASSNLEASADQSKNLVDRIKAYIAYESEQKALIDQERDYKRLTENLTAKEVEALEADHQNKLNELTRAGVIERRKLQKEVVETRDSSAKDSLATNYDQELETLNKSFEDRKISQKKYEEEKKKLDLQYASEQLQTDIATTRDLIALTQEGTKERYDLEKKLADDLAKLSDDGVKKAEEAAAKKAKVIERDVKYEQQAAKIAQSLVDDSYTRQLNNIKKQEDDNTKAKDKAVTDTNNSTLSAQDKAAKLIQIEEQAKVTQDQLDKKRRDTQLRQAKFDKDAQVLEIIGNTLVAASKAGFITPEGIAIEAEGLIQAALLAAKPLPRFAGGTPSSPAGWALTDEEGPEGYITPSGKAFMGNDHATLRYLDAGTRIIRHDQLRQYQQNTIHESGILVMPDRRDNTEREIRGLRSDLQQQTSELKKAYGQIKRPIVIFKPRDLKRDYIP